jgi:hypothetical protein
MYFRIVTLAAALGSIFALSDVHAQSGGGRADPETIAKLRSACGQDIRQHCASVQRGNGGIVKCLLTNQQTSAGCQAALRQFVAQRRGSNPNMQGGTESSAAAPAGAGAAPPR